jgi:phosphotransferase family enzyme
MTGLIDWTSAEWRAAAESWLDERLAVAGIERTGPVTQPRVRAWGTVLTAPTVRGPVWLKAPAPETVFEVALYELLGSVVPGRVLDPIAVDVSRGWVLLPDGGPVIANDDFAALARMLSSYGELQQAVASHVDDLLSLGVADMRPAAMPARFEEALEVARRSATDEDRPALDRIAGMRAEFGEWCARLAESPVPVSIDHNDLHPGNVFASGTVYDWGDSVVAHSFTSMLIALGYLNVRHGLGPGDPVVERVRDAYLEPFTDLAPRAELVAEIEVACRVAKVARALTWERAVRLDPGDFARAPLETLLGLEAHWMSLGR